MPNYAAIKDNSCPLFALGLGRVGEGQNELAIARDACG